MVHDLVARVAEVLLGSVPPFQLMFGKLLGMSAVCGYLIFWDLSRRGWETLSGKEPVAQKQVARVP